MRWRKSPGKRPNPLSVYSPAFRHGALRFIPWPHVSSYASSHVSSHGPMFRHTLRFMFRPWPHVSPYTSSHASSHGPMPMASYFVMRPQPRSSPAAEFKRYPEAIQDRARPSGRWDRRRLVVLIRATGLGDDWLSGPDRTTDSEPIRDLSPSDGFGGDSRS